MRIRGLTYTNVIATVALFVALGGSSYAALTITGGNIRNGTLTGTDLKDGSVTSRDADNGTITGSDLKDGSVTSTDVEDESLRATDVKAGQAAAGPAGPQGPPGETRAPTRRAADVLLRLGDTAEATASCEPGEVAVGGGAGHDGLPDDAVAILADEPLKADGSPPSDGQPATQWRAIGSNLLIGNGPPEARMTVYVLCAKA
jgi:hypothetical protein